MKKFLLTSALILALVLSLTAGTMAAYTQQVATFKSDVTTRKFTFATTGTDSFNDNFNIAPGDKIVKKIKLSNTGEVKADVAIVAKLVSPNGGDLPKGMSFTIERKDGTTSSVNKAHEAKATNELENGKSGEYELTVNWDYGTVTDGVSTIAQNADAGKAFSLNVEINAIQVNENRTNYAVPSNP